MGIDKSSSMIDALEWDSAEFGFKCGILKVEDVEGSGSNSVETIANAMSWARKEKYRFITCKVDARKLDIVNACFTNNGVLVDTELTFAKDIQLLKGNSDSNNRTTDFSVTKMKTYWHNSLYDLSNTLQFSRFFIDKEIPKHLAQKIWSDSIFNNCNGRASYSIVCFHESRPVGLMNIFEKNEVADIFLIAVLPEYQSLGVGREMLLCFENSINSDIKKITVDTQAINYGAINFYFKHGYKNIASKYIIHFWLN